MHFCLKHNWAEIIQRAWSIRFMAIAAVLTFIEALMPFLKDYGIANWLPGGVFALLSCFVVMAAFVSRLMAQKNL
jgi:hypothetical protein